jgi:hypothetical protein
MTKNRFNGFFVVDSGPSKSVLLCPGLRSISKTNTLVQTIIQSQFRILSNLTWKYETGQGRPGQAL